MRVELAAVGKRFGRVVALREVSLALASGERAALIGPNGAGKSTLTRIVMGMLTCSGEVRLDDRSPFRHRAELAHRLGYVPQVAPQLAATVGELVHTVARLRGLRLERIAAAAADLGLDLAALRRRSLRHLSGGMRQKLLLALALASDAELLILDEPTASLDVDSRQRFFERIAALPSAPTLLLCSHRLEEIRHLVDRVLVLEDGAIAHDGDAATYLRRSGAGVLEVLARSERGRGWLLERGFSGAASGWCRRELRNGQRVAVVREVVRELGDELGDMVLRDVERIDGGEGRR